MQKFLSKYGLAAHLALLAVAPLFLCPFFSGETVATVLCWLSPYVFSWILLEPSRRRGEVLHESRVRVWRSIVRDPLFWVLVVTISYAAVRWLNGGIRLVYDAEAETWSVHESVLSFLPGSVTGSARQPFSTVLALTVVIMGCRHALGKGARTVFIFTSSLISGGVAVALASLAVFGDAHWADVARCSYLDPSFIGICFGLYLIAAFFALAEGGAEDWTGPLPFFVISIGGNLLGVYFFAPPLAVVVFFAAALLAAFLSQVVTARRYEMAERLKCLIVLFLSLALPVMAIVAFAPGWLTESRLAALTGKTFFPDGYFDMRAALSRIAGAVWKGSPWLGSGLGSFPLDIRFNATEADWALFQPGQTAVPSGWWQLLVERGIVGVAFFAVPVLFLFAVWAWRLVGVALKFSAEARLRSFFFEMQSIAWMALIGVGTLVALAFFDASFFRSDVLLAIGAFMALSCGSLPAVRKATPDGEASDESLEVAES